MKKVIIGLVIIFVLIIGGLYILSFAAKNPKMVPYMEILTETQIGIVVNKISGDIDKEYKRAVTAVFNPPWIDLYRINIAVRQCPMLFDLGQGQRQGHDDLVTKCATGSEIGVSLIIEYSIIPEKAYVLVELLAEEDGCLDERIDEYARKQFRGGPRKDFGALEQDEFYDSLLRMEKARQATDRLNVILNPKGILVKRISVDDYRYLYTPYEDEIDATLVDREKAKQAVLAIDTQAEVNKTRLSEEQKEVNEKLEKVKGTVAAGRSDAEAYLVEMKKKAEHILTKGKADAAVITQQRLAYACPGAAVALQIEKYKKLSSSGLTIFSIPESADTLGLRHTNLNGILSGLGLGANPLNAGANNPDALKKAAGQTGVGVVANPTVSGSPSQTITTTTPSALAITPLSALGNTSNPAAAVK